LVSRITRVLPIEVMLPAVGQGALAIECRAADAATCAAVTPLDDPATNAAVVAERALLAHLRGGCMAPVGALARIEGKQLQLTSAVLSAEGTQRVFAQDSAEANDLRSAAALGRRVADALLGQGAAELIAVART
jgi:hydroxymethylbilane synthase